MEATGVLAAGETTTAMAYIKGRRGVSPYRIKLILLVCMLAIGLPVGALVSGSWVAAALSAESALIGLLFGLLIINRMSGPSMRKALFERGQEYMHPLKLHFTTEALVYELGDISMTADWRCVTDLFATKKHWVFLVQSSAMVLPRRFFISPEAERDFIAEAMSRMTDSVRTRSPDAAKVIGASR